MSGLESDTRTGRTAGGVLIIADDLAGAAEAGAKLLTGAAVSGELLLNAAASRVSRDRSAVIDTDSRYRADAEAASRVRSALDGHAGDRIVLKKIDSLLRGRIAAEVGALRAAGRRPVVAAALPELRRTVLGGVVHLGSTPLHRSGSWAAESQEPPPSVSAALRFETRIVPLETVRNPTALLPALVDALDRGLIPVCDSVTADDLDAVVDASLAVPGVVLVGSSSLARSLNRFLPRGARSAIPRREPKRVIVVAGTLSPSIDRQLERLVEAGAHRIDVRPEEAGNADLAAALSSSKAQVIAIATERSAPWRREDIALLAGTITPAIDLATTDVVLTGGETARRVFDSFGIDHVTIGAELGPGVAALHTDHGATLITRPGSFGDADSLVDAVASTTARI